VYELERSKSIASETAVLVRVILPQQLFDDGEPLVELEAA
jgi:hypothetical protein